MKLTSATPPRSPRSKFAVRKRKVLGTCLTSEKQNPQPRLMEIADAGVLTSSCSDCEWPVAHARCHAQRSTDCRQNRNQNLNQRLPSFLLHNFSEL